MNMTRKNHPIVIMLAAGKSTRFRKHKLLHRMNNGREMILQSVAPFIKLGLEIHIICNAEDQALHRLLERESLPYAIVLEAHKGMGNTISAAVSMFPSDSGWLIALADMPFVTQSCIATILAHQGSSVVRPVFQCIPGHPVYFPSFFKTRLQQLYGDKGAGILLKNEKVVNINMHDSGCVIDIDTPEALRRSICKRS